MRTLIIHKAPQKHGKTISLECLIGRLCNDSQFVLLYPTSKDENMRFIIGKYRGQNVGIITFGDLGYENEQMECLEQCLQANCDIIIVASRTKGQIYHNLYSFGKNNNLEIIETSPIFLYDYDCSKFDTQVLNEFTSSFLLSVMKYV